MSCQTSVAFGCIVLLTTSTLFFYLYFGVYLRYKFKQKGTGTYDSVLEVAIAFMCVCACAFVITLLFILRCLIKPGVRRQAVSPEGEKLAVNLSSVVVTSPENRVISSKTYKTRTRISVSPTHEKIPENEPVPKVLPPPKLETEKPDIIKNGIENGNKIESKINEKVKDTNEILKARENETKPKEIEAVLKEANSEFKNLGKAAKIIPEIELKNKNGNTIESKIQEKSKEVKESVKDTEIETKPKEIEATLKEAKSDFQDIGKAAKITPEPELKNQPKKEKDSDVKIIVEDSDMKQTKPEKELEKKKALEEPVIKPATSVTSLEVPATDIKENDDKFWSSLDKKDDGIKKTLKDKNRSEKKEKPEKSEAVIEVATSIQMGKWPAKVEQPFKKPAHTCGKDHSKEKQNKYAEKVLADFNPCFPTPKKRSDKSRGGDKVPGNVKKDTEIKTVENDKTGNDNSIKNTSNNSLTDKMAVTDIKNKSTSSIKMGQDKLSTPLNDTFTIKNKSPTFKKSATDIKNKSSKSTNLAVDKTTSTLNDTFTVNNKSSSSLKNSATDLNNKSTSSINNAQDKTTTSLNDTIKEKEKTAANLGDTIVIGKSTPFPRNGNPIPIFSVIPTPSLDTTLVVNNGNKKSEETVKTATAEINEVVILYEVGADTKLGYWGWNYEHWS